MSRSLVRRLSSSSPPPAEGFLPGVSESAYIHQTPESALSLPELQGKLKTTETKKLNLCQAVNEGLQAALSSDETAGARVFL
jgi:2-oxoisovalerate dehydrogenase E1 component beta subunit